MLLRALRLTGELDEPALHRAVSRLVARHPALRTCFEQRDGVTVQVVGAVPSVVLDVEELSDDAAVTAWLRDRSMRPLKLVDERPPVRIALLCTRAGGRSASVRARPAARS